MLLMQNENEADAAVTAKTTKRLRMEWDGIKRSLHPEEQHIFFFMGKNNSLDAGVYCQDEEEQG